MTAILVLHVEDEPDIREVVEIALGLDADFVTRSCGSGREALEIAEDWSPDIILMDVMMPVMDGPATLARLRDNMRTARIPVVFMTACAQTRELDLFRSLGIAGVIPKPFNAMTLVASVRAYLKPVVVPLGAVLNIFLRRVNNDAAMLARYRFALKSGYSTPTTLARIQDIAHGLAGASGIFGYSEIGAAAAALEETVIVARDDTGFVHGILSALDLLLSRVEANSTLRVGTSHSHVEA